MHDLDFLIYHKSRKNGVITFLGEPIYNDKKIRNFRAAGHFVHQFYAAGFEFYLPDISVGWFLTMARDPENFFENFFIECNDKAPPEIFGNDAYVAKILEILFANISNKSQTETGEHNPSDLVLSIAMIVKHLGLSYGDILALPLVDFYTIAENSGAILGQAPLPETSQSKHADGTALMALKSFMRSAK